MNEIIITKHKSQLQEELVFNWKDGLKWVLREWVFRFSTRSYRSAPGESIYHYWFIVILKFCELTSPLPKFLERQNNSV